MHIFSWFLIRNLKIWNRRGFGNYCFTARCFFLTPIPSLTEFSQTQSIYFYFVEFWSILVNSHDFLPTRPDLGFPYFCFHVLLCRSATHARSNYKISSEYRNNINEKKLFGYNRSFAFALYSFRWMKKNASRYFMKLPTVLGSK